MRRWPVQRLMSRRRGTSIKNFDIDAPRVALWAAPSALAPPAARAAPLDWRDASTWPAAQPLVFGADLIYAREAVQPLLKAVDGLVATGDRGRSDSGP